MWVPLLKGDFEATVEWTYVNDPRDREIACQLGTYPDGQNIVDKSAGIGIILQSAPWGISMQQYGTSREVLSSGKPVVAEASRGALQLKREGTRYTGTFLGKYSDSAAKSAYDAARIRFVAYDNVRITRFEVKGKLDPEWIKERLGAAAPAPAPAPAPGKGAALWNGKLDEWDTFGYPYTVSGGALSIHIEDAGSCAVHKSSASARSARFAMEVEFDAMFAGTPGPTVGFFIYKGGGVTGEGNLTAVIGKMLVFSRVKRGQMELAHQQEGSKMIAPGRWALEIIVSNGDITLRVEGVGETTYRGALAPGDTFQPGVWVQKGEARVTRFEKK